MKQDDFCCGHALQLQHSTFPNLSEIASRVPKICDFKNWLSFFLFFFFLSHTYKNSYKTRTPYPIALNFGTQKGDIKTHLGTNFGWNTINRQSYERLFTPICCHAYRVNRVWEEAENRWVNRLTIEPQTFCGLKEIELKNRKIQRKNQQCVTITQSRLANKKNDCLPRLPDKPLGVMLLKSLYRWSNHLRKAHQWCRRIRLKETEL